MVGEQPFQGITMADVARRCGLAKGTLYLYFKSKEELFLATLEDEVERWFEEVSGLLAGIDPRQGNADAVASAIAGSLATRRTLTDLMSILHNVLEHNIDVQTAIGFKRMLLGKLQAGAVALESVLPGLRPGMGMKLLLRANALVVGLQQMSDPADAVATALEQPDLAAMKIEFEAELRASLVALIHGMT